MKKSIIPDFTVKCSFCDFQAKFDLETNKHGFFEIPEFFCPNDMSQLLWASLPEEIETEELVLMRETINVQTHQKKTRN